VKTRTAVAFFSSGTAAAGAVGAIIGARVSPSVLELLDGGALAAIDRAQGSALRERGEALLLAQTDGYGADAEIDALGSAVAAAGGRVEFPDDAAADHYLWLRRHGRGPTPDVWMIGEDVAVPRTALPSMLVAIQRIGTRHGLDVSVVAHAGDGNLHPLFTVAKHPDDQGPPAVLLTAADELIRAAIERGGTISGEHGVGITKRDWLTLELGRESLALQRRIKAAFDPQGILNPHTWLQPVEVVGRPEPADPLASLRHAEVSPGGVAPYGDERS
jgi:glycolate oxidase